MQIYINLFYSRKRNVLKCQKQRLYLQRDSVPHTNEPDELKIKEDIILLNATKEVDLLFLNHLFKQ